MEKAYIIILGDTGNQHYDHMLERLGQIGHSTKLIDNIYILKAQNDKEFGNMELIRNFIAGEEFGYCLVIAINSGLMSAWNLPRGMNELLTNIVKEQTNEGK